VVWTIIKIKKKHEFIMFMFSIALNQWSKLTMKPKQSFQSTSKNNPML